MADRDRYPSTRRRSNSPPYGGAASSSRKYDDRSDRRSSGRDSYRDEPARDRRSRGGDRDRNKDDDDNYERDARRHGSGTRSYRDRSRSPPQVAHSSSRAYGRDGDDRGKGRDAGKRRSRSPVARRNGGQVAPATGGGDGGWGRRETAGEGGGLPDQNALVPGGSGGGPGRDGKEVAAPPKPVEPDFKPSGALAAETNTLNGVVLKYAEPPEARKPVRNWRLYVFKGKEQVELFHVHRQSAYLIGRDRIVADIPVDHPSASKQHAVLQFRQVVERNEFGDTKSLTKPFLIDLDSANGTLVNDETVPASRFYELRSGDVLKFAFSTREYVLLVES
ncbi:hypothetical protein BMF94_1470 [Rhodotorula taiwanensis]|uniref:FHA domain-containing protein n=1 Tax=Rhodotorula taiwanensis TaxID=741276 RepID=A0A2S5BF60_9BASI|nr:hypothetical protein BMF94_1470 [Rhodotorula taiwanensis]